MTMTRIIITVTGDPCTGKTTLVNHFIDECLYNQETVPTIAFDYFVKIINDVDYGEIEFRIWDTSGDEKFCGPSFISTYYRTTNAVLVLFDVTSRDSFSHVSTVWLPRIRSACLHSDSVKLCLVGNKTDLIKNRVISTSEAMDFAIEYNMLYIEVSSLESQYEELRLPFYIVAKELIDYQLVKSIKKPKNQLPLYLGEDVEEKEMTCCHHG